MSLVVGLFGLLIGAMGVVGIASPSRLIAFASRWHSQRGLYAAAIIRLVLGAALILAAPDARAPVYFRVVGAVTIVAGLAMPLVGLRRTRAILDWWSRRPAGFIRGWSIVIVLFGLSLLWAISP